MRNKSFTVVALLVVLSLLPCITYGSTAKSASKAPTESAAINPGISNQEEQDDVALKRDIDNFIKSAAQLERYCETALTENSFLARAGIETNMTSPQQLRGVYRFWASFLKHLDTLEEISDRRHVEWGTALFDTKVSKKFESYILGIDAKAARMAAASQLANYLAKRKKLKTIFDEAMPEYKIPPKRLTHHTLDSVSPRNILALYQFSISHKEDLDRFYKIPPDPDFSPKYDKSGKLYLYFLGMHDVLDGLILRIAKNPVWYKYAFGLLADNAEELAAPTQEALFTWVGDMRVRKRQTRLIAPEQVDEMEKAMQPGDIIIERQNWYLSNIFLGGFWPHGALYIGDAQKLADFLDNDAQVAAYYKKRNFSGILDWLKKTYPSKYTAYTTPNEENGRLPSVIEAVSEGVILNTLRHTCHADYIGVLRPRLSKLDIAKAIETAFYYNGRSYDFNFDFYTETDLVCTELIVKCYAPFKDKKGLVFPTESAMGRQAVRADEFVRTLIREKGSPKAQLEFVYFLRGIEKAQKAVIADQKALEDSINWRGGLAGPKD